MVRSAPVVPTEMPQSPPHGAWSSHRAENNRHLTSRSGSASVMERASLVVLKVARGGAMGRLPVRRSSLRGRLGGGKGLLFAALLLPATAVFVTTTAASREADLKRLVLGTIVTPGTLEVGSGPGNWIPATEGAPILEETELRTGPGKKAMIAMGKEGVIGVREGSGLRIGSIGTEGTPITLQGESELTFRLPITTTLTFFTDAAVVKASQPIPASAQEAWIQGTITQRGSETTVSVIEGDLRVRNRDAADFATLGSGEQATITGSLETPRIARMTDASETTSRRGLAAMFGTKSGLFAAGVTALAVGGGVCGAAAAGAFDSSEAAAQGGPGEPAASPFRP